MKNSFYFILPAVLALHISTASALDIDEKLTLRFLKVSSTKKTVLVNRGGEDGLVVGDHAKFFITAGVVARGVAEKVSPSRSVWALYRIVDPTEIVQDKALNLKIATPAKITDDPSKSLKEEVIPGGADATVTEVTSLDGETSEVKIDEVDKEELKGMGFDEDAASEKPVAVNGKIKDKKAKNITTIEDVPTYSTNRSKVWEVWATLYFNSLSGTVEDNSSGVAADSTSVASSTIDYSGGVEWYFLNSTSFLKEVSLAGFLHKKTVENGDSIKWKGDWLEYGVGVNYHFYNSAAAINRLVSFATFTLGRGNAKLETKTVVNGIGEESSIEGSNSFFSAGVGAKYTLSNGFGVRAILDYYSSKESYSFDAGDSERTLSGPRIQFGLSYRF